MLISIGIVLASGCSSARHETFQASEINGAEAIGARAIPTGWRKVEAGAFSFSLLRVGSFTSYKALIRMLASL
jgi:hypothetical protein